MNKILLNIMEKSTSLSELPIETSPVQQEELPEVVTKNETKSSKTVSKSAEMCDFLNVYMNSLIIYMIIFILLNTKFVKDKLLNLSFSNFLGESNKLLVVNASLSLVGGLTWIYLEKMHLTK